MTSLPAILVGVLLVGLISAQFLIGKRIIKTAPKWHNNILPLLILLSALAHIILALI
ncbi:MAG: hypothetical protein BWY19_01001 [bacterium ADurb.Bin212]|jgi:hypothetical protein|nr:MAG: hypothetical protein BWY19_01001 [bacterium ADurb.Bin212]